MAAARGARGRVWPSRGKGLGVSSLQRGGGGAPWGTASWVHWRPSSLVQSGSGAQAGSAIHLGGPCGPALPATAKPSAAAQLLAPPPARASSSSSASEAAARSPRRLRAPSPPAGRSFLSPLLLSLSHAPPPRSHVPLALCQVPLAPSRFEVPGGKWGAADLGATDLEPADRSRCRRPPAARSRGTLAEAGGRRSPPRA